MATEDMKLKTAKAYLDFVGRTTTYPTYWDLAKDGISRASVRYHFGSISNLKNLLKAEKPTFFAGVRESHEKTETSSLIHKLFKNYTKRG